MLILMLPTVRPKPNESLGQITLCRPLNEDGLGQTIPVNAQPGDTLRLTFVCQDQFGLEYEFTMDCWQVLKDDAVEVHLDGDRLPILTWPA